MLKLKFLMLVITSCMLPAFLASRTGLTTEALSLQDQRIDLDETMIGCSVIAPLDKCIQERFKKVDGRFGAARIRPPTLHDDNYFKPETPEERELIQELECDGWQVAFYLASRRVLRPGPDQIKIGDRIFDIKSSLNGPISFNASLRYNEDKLTEILRLPKRRQLMDHVKSAMVDFEKKDRYDFAIGKWMFAVRPIRAQESCLKCHNSRDMTNGYWRSEIPTVNPDHTSDNASGEPPVKVGDALGAAIYAIARAQNNN
jgi:hypothetical protein